MAKASANGDFALSVEYYREADAVGSLISRPYLA